ncbi:protein arginine N-methyltransferase [Roseospira visakhapatnamensis]|uniref:Tfp pilus assembly protein PilF n=1 Tax=Roseospira visakhapatnamensis TaxID=390880 RepID=A0A7W6RC93_9PROT|nr:protein arginine N-methyltransferase [Roseospira visakhapatnamensis]MBB4265855.1 Tfp pilus assembly protein PilF [Roseospira visakhapatnamensis]
MPSPAALSTADRLTAALEAHRRGDIATAAAGYRAVLARAPAEADALNFLGLTHYQAGRVDPARRWLERACHARPGAAPARINLATLCQDLGDLETAERHYRRALALAPAAVAALNNLGNALTDMDRPGEALALFDRALALAGGAERGAVQYNRHALLLDRDGLAAAEAALADALRADPGHALARGLAAALALARGAGAVADAHLERLAACPDAAPVLDSLAWIRPALADGARLLGTTIAGLAFALDQARRPGLVLEFGVRFGHSLRAIAARAGQPVHGFDTFTGLPGAWHGHAPGLYSTGGRLPAMPPGVTLHPGLFADTLPAVLAAHPDRAVRFANIDCDLYDSTVDVLRALAPRVGPGTVLAFDEFLMNPGWREDEFRAFHEAADRHGWRVSVLGVSPFAKQAVLRIDGVAGA